VHRVRISRSLSPFFLRKHSRFTPESAVHRSAFHMPVVRADTERVALRVAEFDIADPFG
jgi:hypothetical protein